MKNSFAIKENSITLFHKSVIKLLHVAMLCKKKITKKMLQYS